MKSAGLPTEYRGVSFESLSAAFLAHENEPRWRRLAAALQECRAARGLAALDDANLRRGLINAAWAAATEPRPYGRELRKSAARVAADAARLEASWAELVNRVSPLWRSMFPDRIPALSLKPVSDFASGLALAGTVADRGGQERRPQFEYFMALVRGVLIGRPFPSAESSSARRVFSIAGELLTSAQRIAGAELITTPATADAWRKRLARAGQNRPKI